MKFDDKNYENLSRIADELINLANNLIIEKARIYKKLLTAEREIKKLKQELYGK